MAFKEQSNLKRSSSRWEPVDSQFAYRNIKRKIYKSIVAARAALILLNAAWRMKPYHFEADSDSIFKNLGCLIPFIPGNVYAWAAQAMFGTILARSVFGLSAISFVVCNTLFIATLVYLSALIGFSFHISVCLVGRLFGMDEMAPPYEFFLVRAAGMFMWFAVATALLAVPVLAKEPGIMGDLAGLLFAFPLI